MDERPTVLIVEDQPLIGLSVQDGLEEAGYQTQLHESALDALNELEAQQRP